MLDFVGLRAQHVQIRAEDPDYDGVAGPGEHLFHALLEVRLHVALQAWVAVDDLLDLRDRFVVVDVRRDADPVLGEVDAVGFVGQQRLPDVRAEVVHAGDCPQLLADLLGDLGSSPRDPTRAAGASA